MAGPVKTRYGPVCHVGELVAARRWRSPRLFDAECGSPCTELKGPSRVGYRAAADCQQSTSLLRRDYDVMDTRQATVPGSLTGEAKTHLVPEKDRFTRSGT